MICSPIIDKKISNYFGIVYKWKIAITFPYVFLLYRLWKTVYRHYFTSFLYTLLRAALHPSFHQTLALDRWLSVLVENYQVKLPLSEDNQLKSIKTLQQKTILHVVLCGLWRFNLIPSHKLSYTFCWHNTHCTSFLKENKTNLFLFKKRQV